MCERHSWDARGALSDAASMRGDMRAACTAAALTEPVHSFRARNPVGEQGRRGDYAEQRRSQKVHLDQLRLCAILRLGEHFYARLGNNHRTFAVL